MIRQLVPLPWLKRATLLGRSHTIVSVLTRRGLGWLFSQLISETKGRHSLGLSGGRGGEKQAEQLRLALVELGPTFIKFGQALSARADLLPPVYIDALSKLQDEVPALPFEPMKTVLVRELDAPLEELFASFDPEPVASASIGQVYNAILKNGQEVVVKIRRPDVAETVQQDLEILMDMAEWTTNNSSLGRAYNLVALVDEFAFRLRNELDYQREGHNADTLRHHFTGDTCVTIPHIYWDLTTSQVITIERLRGLKITDIEGMEKAGIDRKVVAENWGRWTVRQLIEFGFFHADPHPGNYFVQADGTLGVVDFGMVGRLNDNTRRALLRMVMAAASGDTAALVDLLLDIGIVNQRIRQDILMQDVSHVIDNYLSNAQHLTAGKVLNEIMNIVFRHGLQLPGEMAMLVRLVAVNEGISMTLFPDFRMLDFAAPYVRQYWEQERAPQRLALRMAQSAVEGLEVGLDLPRQVARLLDRLDRGRVEFNINYDGLRDLTHQMQQMVNRLALAILLGAVIIALGMTMVVYHPASWQRVGEIIFGFAFISSLIFGALLMLNILRSGRK